VSRNDLARLREKIRLRQYDMSAHAMEEMAEDFLTKDDPRGTIYVVVGTAIDRQTPVGVVGRFSTSGRYLIITVYEVTELEG
jgi:hypothetical protein